jgi:hypothetical protein
MANTSPPTYQGQDEAVRRWSQSLAQYLNATFLDLYKIAGRAPTIKTLTITATGATPIGGLGFTPRMVQIIAGDASIDSFSIGFDDGTNHHSVCSFLNASNISQATYSSERSAYLRDNAASNALVAYVSSLNSDGFILTHTVTGTISASLKLLVFP